MVAPSGTSMKRASTGPVIGDPSFCLATGTTIVWLLAVGTTSPCQPLTSETSPSGLGDGLAVAAVDDLIEQDARRSRHVDRLGQREGGDVLDPSARVARGEIDDPG